MANARNSNTWYVDTTSSSGAATSYIDEQNVKIVGVMFWGDATTDSILVSDKAAGSAAVGASKVFLQHGTAKDTVFFDYALRPISCPNGIWVTVVGAPKATLILSSQGG